MCIRDRWWLTEIKPARSELRELVEWWRTCTALRLSLIHILLRCERPEPPNAAGELVDLAAGWVAVYQAGMVCYFNLEAVRSILEAERVE